MIDYLMLYDIMYALAAKDGREAKLFGACAPLAHEAVGRSLAGDAFPEIWFELPLAGDPWFDVHVLTSRDALAPDKELAPDETGGYPEVFEWFARQGDGVRQLALSYDVSRGSIEHPAVQLLVRDRSVSARFLEVAGGVRAAEAYRAFASRLPKGWFPCYTGVFPGRAAEMTRVECVLDDERQRAYAEDAALLETHLREVGVDVIGDTLVPYCQRLARTPFKLEFQFDVGEGGIVKDTVSASVRFDSPPGSDEWRAFEASGPAGALMREVEAWGLADDRWRLFEDAMFSNHVRRGDDAITLFVFPAFLKLRWRGGVPLDAKAYLMAGESATSLSAARE